MATSYSLGLAVCSGSSSTTNRSVFDSVSVTSGVMANATSVPPSWATFGPLSFEDGAVGFTVMGALNSTWLLEESSDGVRWSPLQTITLVGGAIRQSEADDRRPLRLFRLR
jgi:hypothetical protein